MISVPAALARLRIDPYVVAIVLVAGTAAVIPARGDFAAGMDHATSIAIGLLFFLYGARLSASAALDGVRNWRLHLLVPLITFGVFPLLALACQVLVPSVLTPPLYVGLVFLCALPSTVQSSITFTSVAGGNVAAAICAASFSNLLGVLVTPLLVGALLSSGHGGFSPHAVRDIVVLLLLPFLLGQLLQRWVGEWVRRFSKPLGLLERGVILAAVYTAFSEGTVSGIWHQLTPLRIALLVVVNATLLAVVLTATTLVSRWLGFSREDRIAIIFCGSKKSLASGLPMAAVLFPAQSMGFTVLPLMLYHQLQLLVCAWLARRFASRRVSTVEPEEVSP
jgi:solute carrier family 10 (sodium/bile acid cotransporter), member 7